MGIRTVVSWSHRVRAVMAGALLLAGISSSSPAAEDVILSIAERPVRLEPERWGGVEGRVHGVLALTRIPSAEDRERLRDFGVELHQYLPENAFFATVDAARSAELLALDFVRSAEPFRVQWKGPPAVVENPAENLWLLEDGRRQVVVYFFPDVARETALSLVAAFRGEVISDTWDINERLMVALDLASVPLLLERDEVRWMDTGRRHVRSLNTSAASFHGVSEVQETPFGLDGSGVKVGIMDGDVVQANHPDFGNRVTVVKTNGGSADFHSTHVTGTILGSGATNAGAKGMAPGAKSWNWTYAVADQVGTKSLGFPLYGIDVDNNSWGDNVGWEWQDFGWIYYTNTERFGKYISDVGDLDGVAMDAGTLINFAAGNDGGNDGYDGYGYIIYNYEVYYGHYDVSDAGVWTYHNGYHGPDGDGYGYSNLLPHATIKNGLSVGAIDDYGDITDFSSRGPTQDGRLKPDVSAVGADVLSTVPTSTHDSSQGTSMATPVVTGIAALVIEAWNSSHSGADPRLDVLKGLLIHSTFDLGNPGPDYTYGFGGIDARYAATRALIEDGSSAPYHRTGTLSQGGTAEYLLDFTGSPSSIWVTLCWTDVPGNPAASKALVNDLDLVLVSPSGTLHYPWVLNPATPWSNATRGANHLDNVEYAEVASPASGTWKVRVSGYAVPSGPQPFAVWFSHPRYNAPPVADAGGDRQVAAQSPAGATVGFSASGSSDANLDDVLTYRWDTDGDEDYYDAGGSQAASGMNLVLPVGEHLVGLRVEDSFGASDTDQVTVTVTNTPPVASLGTTLTFRADDPEGGTVTLDSSACSDAQTFQDIVEVAWDLDGDGQFDDSSEPSVARRYPLGANPVGLRIIDTQGATDEVTGTVTVEGAEYLLQYGGSFKGAIATQSDVDSFFLQAVKGAVATLVLKSKSSVVVEVEAPSGTTLSTLSTAFAKSAKATLTLPENGWYWLEATPGPGTVGAYALSVKVKPAKLGTKGEVVLNSGHTAEEWSLDLLEGATVSLSAKGAGTPAMELLGPEDQVLARIEGTGKLSAGPVPATGNYRLRLVAEDLVGYATYKVAWRATQPKAKTKIVEGK